MVSHDVSIIDRVCNEIWVAENNTIFKFPGDIYAYKNTFLSLLILLVWLNNIDCVCGVRKGKLCLECNMIELVVLFFWCSFSL